MKREEHREEEISLHDTREIPEDELQRMKVRTDKAKVEAVAGLKSAENFALFYIKKEKNRSGVQVIVAGEMNLKDTMELASAIHETAESIVEGIAEELDTHFRKEA